MKPRSMFVMMAAMAASLKNFFYGKQEAQHSASQPPPKRVGKSKGGRKAIGLINGMPRLSARGTALGSWLKLDSFDRKYHPTSDQRPPMEPNWHRSNRSVAT